MKCICFYVYICIILCIRCKNRRNEKYLWAWQVKSSINPSFFFIITWKTLLYHALFPYNFKPFQIGNDAFLHIIQAIFTWAFMSQLKTDIRLICQLFSKELSTWCKIDEGKYVYVFVSLPPIYFCLCLCHFDVLRSTAFLIDGSTSRWEDFLCVKLQRLTIILHAWILLYFSHL